LTQTPNGIMHDYTNKEPQDEQVKTFVSGGKDLRTQVTANQSKTFTGPSQDQMISQDPDQSSY